MNKYLLKVIIMALMNNGHEYSSSVFIIDFEHVFKSETITKLACLNVLTKKITNPWLTHFFSKIGKI